MPNIEITNNQTRGIVVWEPVFEDATLQAAGAETWPAGTILARLNASPFEIVPFVVGGSLGAEVPKAILTQEVVFAGAGDKAGRVLISGRVRLSEISVLAGGVVGQGIADNLRDFTIIAQSTTQLAELDNQ